MPEQRVDGVIPFLTIRGGRGQEALAFYERAFAASVTERNLADDGERLMHAAFRINGGTLMLADEFPEWRGHDEPSPAGTTLHLEVDDADAWASRAVAAGAEVTMPVADQFWGARYGQLIDPFGHRWSIGSPVKGD